MVKRSKKKVVEQRSAGCSVYLYRLSISIGIRAIAVYNAVVVRTYLYCIFYDLGEMLYVCCTHYVPTTLTLYIIIQYTVYVTYIIRLYDTLYTTMCDGFKKILKTTHEHSYTQTRKHLGAYIIHL